MRRHGPEPPPGPPQIQLKPGLANEMLRDLAPLLAEEGIDVDNIDVPDLDTLQAAMNHAVERHNMARFTPVGQARDLAVATLRLAVEAIADGDTVLAAAVLNQVAAESPDNSAATVASCIGVAWACSTAGCPAAIHAHRTTSANARSCRPGTGSANARRTTSSPLPTRAARSAPSTR